MVICLSGEIVVAWCSFGRWMSSESDVDDVWFAVSTATLGVLPGDFSDNLGGLIFWIAVFALTAGAKAERG